MSEKVLISPQLRRELLAIALLLFAVFLLGAILVPGEVTEGVSCTDSNGLFGPVGSCLSGALIWLVGKPAALSLPLVPALYSLRTFGRLPDTQALASWPRFAAGMFVILPMLIGLATGALPESRGAGIWGSFASYYLVRTLGTAGAWVFSALCVCALTAATLAWNPIRMVLGKHRSPEQQRKSADLEVEALVEIADRKGRRALPAVISDAPFAVTVEELDNETDAGADAPPADEKPGKPRARRKRADTPVQPIAAPRVAARADGELPDITELLPSPELLTPAPQKHADVGKRELDTMGEKLMDALRTFRVEGELIGRTTGPVVTQFEVAPAAGVKVRQIASLANDLALAMRAPSIRIVAPIPGRGAVGVEVPNPAAEMVAFRELIESREFQGARAALPIALGKDLEGRPVIADLAKMPHLLIAGATGSGKSVCVNTLITSLIYRHTPRELRFLMVDPKMVELSAYNVLPHLRHKVVTDNRDAASALKWAVIEMQSRYELLAANGARNIQDFNRRVLEGAVLKQPKNPEVAFEETTYRGSILPYIVVVIDELADLMMTVQGEIETPLALLAQKARAIGIHLILATQRPSVNVITGLIKANFPSRIAFRVASQVDSRTIIDGIGAESLLGNGDMLFIPPGKSEPSRLQGAYISTEDTERLTGWYVEMKEKRRAVLEARGLFAADAGEGEVDILETVRAREAMEAGGEDGDPEAAGDRDKLFREAAEVVIQHQQGSTSLLQRRLKVGYGRAARIIDQLHTSGVLGPPDGSKPREVLVGLSDLDRICGPR